MTYTQTCERCGAKPPLTEEFWTTRHGQVICKACNAEWAVLEEFWHRNLREWAGHDAITVRRHRWPSNPAAQALAAERGRQT